MKRDEFDSFAEQSWTDSRGESGPERRGARGCPSPSNLTSPHLATGSSLSPSQQVSGFSRPSSRATLSSMNSTHSIQHFSSTLDSPVGALSLVATDHALVALVWRREAHARCIRACRRNYRTIRCCARPRVNCANISPASAALSTCRSNFAARNSSAVRGPRCSPFPMAKRGPTGRWPNRSATPPRFAPWVRRTAETRSRSSLRVTASSA